MLGIIAILWLKLFELIGFGIENWLLDREVLEIINIFDLICFCFDQLLLSFGGSGKIKVLIVFDTLKLCFAFELF